MEEKLKRIEHLAAAMDAKVVFSTQLCKWSVEIDYESKLNQFTHMVDSLNTAVDYAVECMEGEFDRRLEVADEA